MSNRPRTDVSRRGFALPTTLAVAVLVASVAGCAPPAPPVVNCGPADASTDACTQATADDGAVLYTVCPSQVNCECARLVELDGAVVDPTFC